MINLISIDKHDNFRILLDGAVIISAPSATVATISIAVTSTGAFSSFETHELISTDDMIGILAKAKALSYKAPCG